MSFVGRTASAPYTRAKGVWPVAQFGVVLTDQRTTGNSSIQHLPLLCSLSKVFVLQHVQSAKNSNKLTLKWEGPIG